MRLLQHLLRKPDAGDGGGSEGAGDGGADAAGNGATAAAAAAGEGGNAGGAAGAAGAGAGKDGAASAAGAGDSGKAGEGAAKGDAASGAGESKQSWRDDWRETMAKGDAKVLARLQRYASPEALSDAFIHAEKRITSGELKPVLKKDATAEQIAEWRTANGIPEAADKYDVMANSKLTDEAKAFLGGFLPIAHSANFSNDQVKAALGFMAGIDKAEKTARAEKDVELEDAGEETLRAEWGGEYKRNITFIHNLLDGAATPEFKDKLLGGRLADGTPIGSDPAALRFLMGLALVQNPAGTVVPGFNNNPAQGVDEEIAKIEGTMRSDRAAYNKDEKMQARYRELLDAREKLKTRG